MVVVLTLLAAFVAKLMGRTFIAITLVLIAGGLLVTSDGLLGQAVDMGGNAVTWIGTQADRLA